MTVWIVKYALTRGIFETTAEQCLDTQPNGSMIQVKTSLHRREYYHGEGRQWCRTKSEAMEIARKMRDRKVRALQTQLAKIQALFPES